MTLTESRPGVADSGEHIASALGLDCLVIDRLAWSRRAPLEHLFTAGDGQGKEILFAGAGDALRDRLLVTGIAGDSAWGGDPATTNGDLARSNHSGLSLTEYRLHAGFLHLPLPQMGLRQHADLTRLSRAPELIPWRVEGRYSRPIPRRIVEEAGIDREAFGRRKTGASIRFMRGEDPWSRAGRAAFVTWLRAQGNAHGANRSAWFAAAARLALRDRALRLATGRRGLVQRLMLKVSKRLSRRLDELDITDLAFVWAIECVRALYPLQTRQSH
jgi:hypothetical protein